MAIVAVYYATAQVREHKNGFNTLKFESSSPVQWLQKSPFPLLLHINSLHVHMHPYTDLQWKYSQFFQPKPGVRCWRGHCVWFVWGEHIYLHRNEGTVHIACNVVPPFLHPPQKHTMTSFLLQREDEEHVATYSRPYLTRQALCYNATHAWQLKRTA